MAISTQNARSARSAQRPLKREVTLYVMLSGVLGGLFMTILMATVRLTGVIALNVERSFGALLLGKSGPVPWLIGLGLHLALSAVFALFYAEGFRRLGRADWKLGAAFGVVQWLVVGAFMGILPSLRPVLSSMLAAPGPYGLNSGYLGFSILLVLHLCFGAIIGSAFQTMVVDHPEVLKE